MARIEVDEEKLIRLIENIHNRTICIPYEIFGLKCDGIECNECPLYCEGKDHTEKTLEMLESARKQSCYEGYTIESYVSMIENRIRDIAKDIVEEMDKGNHYDISTLTDVINYYNGKIIDKECEETNETV